MWFGGDPHPEGFVDSLCDNDGLQQLIHELQAQMTVLQEHPASLRGTNVGRVEKKKVKQRCHLSRLQVYIGFRFESLLSSFLLRSDQDLRFELNREYNL